MRGIWRYKSSRLNAAHYAYPTFLTEIRAIAILKALRHSVIPLVREVCDIRIRTGRGLNRKRGGHGKRTSRRTFGANRSRAFARHNRQHAAHPAGENPARISGRGDLW